MPSWGTSKDASTFLVLRINPTRALEGSLRGIIFLIGQVARRRAAPRPARVSPVAG
jgi:hypothetical protein